jgi:hypothetical protein
MNDPVDTDDEIGCPAAHATTPLAPPRETMIVATRYQGENESHASADMPGHSTMTIVTFLKPRIGRMSPKRR